MRWLWRYGWGLPAGLAAGPLTQRAPGGVPILQAPEGGKGGALAGARTSTAVVVLVCCCPRTGCPRTGGCRSGHAGADWRAPGIAFPAGPTDSITEGKFPASLSSAHVHGEGICHFPWRTDGRCQLARRRREAHGAAPVHVARMKKESEPSRPLRSGKCGDSAPSSCRLACHPIHVLNNHRPPAVVPFLCPFFHLGGHALHVLQRSKTPRNTVRFSACSVPGDGTTVAVRGGGGTCRGRQ